MTARSRPWAPLLEGRRGLALRLALVVAAAIAVARLHAVRDPGVLCPLRAVTGVPCPLCGSTTVFIELGSGDLAAAFAAQPATFIAAALAVAAPLTLAACWQRLSSRSQTVLVGALALGSWVYQLHRM